MNDNWKVIPSLESYVINEDGIIKALPKIREGKLDCLNNHAGCSKKSQRKYREHIIKQKYTSRYWYVCLTHNGIKKTYRVHRLVYKTFVGDIPEGMVIDYIDGNRDNNNIHNLRCVTLSENCRNPNTSWKQYKAVIMVNPTTNKPIREFESIQQAETFFGKKWKPELSSHIGDVCNGKRKTCHNYKWIWK